MKKGILTALIIVAVSAVILSTISGLAQERGKPMGNESPNRIQKWEYKAVNFAERVKEPDYKYRSTEEELNELGREGWQLVAIDPTYWDTTKLVKPVTDTYHVHAAYGATFYFKRPLPGQ
jgi:hypothetical protein